MQQRLLKLTRLLRSATESELLPSSTAYPVCQLRSTVLKQGAEPYLRSRQLCSHSRTSFYGNQRFNTSLS
jgi:hypothetical protein